MLKESPMPVVKPCIVATMGSTRYYETTMTGRELASTVRPAQETDDWASAGIEERMQREFNWSRIRTQLAPYLAKSADRFFGSIIVLVQGGSLEFEPIGEIVTENLPAAYRESAQHLGFVTINEGEHIALDGQHRLLAFREVITSGENLGEFASRVADDEVCVLLLEFDDKRKTRRIFNNVNRHAKPTSRSDNIITDEDDGVAIVTRRLLDQDLNAPLAGREVGGENDVGIVNWRSNTLSKSSRHITTISSVYETVKAILTFEGFEWVDAAKNPVAPPEEELERAYDIASTWWEEILKMQIFATALNDRATMQDIRAKPEHPSCMLLRPVGQVAMVDGVVQAIGNSDRRLTLADALQRVEQVDWSCDLEKGTYWRGTIVTEGGRMVARKEARELAARLLAFLIGSEFMSEDEVERLKEDWNNQRQAGKGQDQDPGASKSEDLPKPIV